MTPGCSVCGYGVEFVRSCFRSQWRLFRNNPVTTAGRYFFGDDSTPVYPGWHNLWSRDWVSDELDSVTLGEDPAAVRSYSLGAPLGPIAPPAVLGSADCIANGETWPLPVVPTLEGGFSVACFAGLAPAFQPLDIRNQGNWCFWAEVLDLAYASPVAAQQKVATALGVPVSGYAQAQAVQLVPTWFVLTAPAPAPMVVVITGATTTAQWLAQILYGGRPPVAFGQYATHPVWEALSTDFLERLRLIGASATQDIIIVGHSMGGAVAACMAARLRLHAPARRIQLLTLGSPRPGDSRLIDLTMTMDVVNLQNDGDIVLSVPYNLADFPLFILPLLASFYPPGSPLWAWPANRYRVAWDGTIQQGAAAPGGGPVYAQIILWGVGAGPFPDFSAHLIPEYARRICAPAPAPVLWLDAWDLNGADGDLVAAWPNKVSAFNSPQATFAQTIPTMALQEQSIVRAVLFTGNNTLALPSAVGGSAWSLYAVLAIYAFPPTWQNEARSGVPLSSLTLTNVVDCTWRGSGLGGPTLDVLSVPDEATVPVADPTIVHLLRVVADLASGTLEVSLEGPCTFASTTSSLTAPILWQFVGGCFPTPCGPIGHTGGFYLCELLLYDPLLSSADDASVLTYLRQKWLQAALTTESGDCLTTESGDVLTSE